MRQEIDKIEIKDPPLEELNKKRSCLKRTCITGCSCFVIMFLVSLVLLRFTMGPRAKELKDLPQSFIKNIPIYDIEGIEKITYTSGKERGRIVEFTAYIPKLVLSPFVVYFDKEYKYIPIYDSANRDVSNWEKFIAFLSKPIADHRDILKIEWVKLNAKQSFVVEYYQTELKKQNFEIGLKSKNDNVIQFTFTKDNIDGVVYTMDEGDTEGVDYVSLTTNIPIE